MASRLEKFEESHGAPRRYPWGDWADGSPWEIRRGDDYHVATESMRVSLHMKAKQLGCKVRTRKVAGVQGEGLVFQFLKGEGFGVPTSATDGALNELYQDCCYIYETARREVTIPRRDGTHQKYAAIRFKQQVDRARAEGQLARAVASIVERRTEGFKHLEDAGRDDLMLETFVLDESKSYHQLFSDRTLAIARARMVAYHRHRPRG